MIFKIIETLILSLFVLDFAVSNLGHKCLDLLLSNISDQLQTDGESEYATNVLNEPDEQGDTLLHMAAHNQDHRLITKLLNLGCDVNARNDHGCTPLHKLTQSDKMKRPESTDAWEKCVDALLLSDETDVYATNADGDKPFDGDLLAAIRLKEKLEQSNQLKRLDCRPIMSILNDAIFSDDVPGLHNIFNDIKNKDDKILTNHYIGSKGLIFKIVSLFDQDLLQRFLDVGGDPWQLSVNGELPLQLALSHGHLVLVDILIDAMKISKCQQYIDLREYSYQYLSILLLSIETEKTIPHSPDYNGCLSRLLQRDVLLSINAQDVTTRQNALQIASIVGNQEAMRLLIGKGANISIKREINKEETSGIFGALLPSTLTAAVNDCIDVYPSNKYKPTDVAHPSFTLELDCSFLLPPTKINKSKSQTNRRNRKYQVANSALEIGADSNHQNCLQLPLMEALLDAKWGMIYEIVLLNALLTAIFLVFLVVQCVLLNCSFAYPSAHYNDAMTAISVLMMPLVLFIAVRECLELYTIRKSYFKTIENYFEWFLVTAAIFINFVNMKQLSAVHLTAWATIIAL